MTTALIDSINGDGNWNKNPWVWVIEFQPYFMNVDDFMKATPDQLAENLLDHFNGKKAVHEER